LRATLYFQPPTTERGAWAHAYLPCGVEVQDAQGKTLRLSYDDVQRSLGVELNPGQYSLVATSLELVLVDRGQKPLARVYERVCGLTPASP
jgi:hypothetical protein